MKPTLFHPKAREVIKTFSKGVRKELGKAIFDLQKGHPLGMPLSRPMPSVAVGVEELRIRDRAGLYRTFYFTKSLRGILIFHAFVKRLGKHHFRKLNLEGSASRRCLMKKPKSLVAKNATELAHILGLSSADGAEIELRSALHLTMQ